MGRATSRADEGDEGMSTTLVASLDGKRLAHQLAAVRAFMLNRINWFTLREIENCLGYPQASISARLRELRKLGYTVERRRRSQGTHEYRVVPREPKQERLF